MADWLCILIPLIGFVALNYVINQRVRSFFSHKSSIVTLLCVTLVAYVIGFLVWICLTESHIVRTAATDWFITYVVVGSPIFALLYRCFRK